MPVIVRVQSLPLPADLAERLARLAPAFAVVPPSGDDAVLYIGWFNNKPISAVWASGMAEGRQLTGFAVHPATRGRGVLARLAQEARELEAGTGRRVLSADDYTALDVESPA